MGCDIHVHVEIKVKGKWLHYNHPNVSRNYQLFAKMAGVRNDTIKPPEPIAEPRGLPADISETTRFDSEVNWNGDGHSHSWLSAQEIARLEEWVNYEMKWEGKRELQWWMEDQFGYLFGNSLAGFVKDPECSNYLREAGLEDVRLVFWFDN